MSAEPSFLVPLELFEDYLDEINFVKKTENGLIFFWMKEMDFKVSDFNFETNQNESVVVKKMAMNYFETTGPDQDYHLGLYRAHLFNTRKDPFIQGFDDRDELGNYSYEQELASREKLLSLSEKKFFRKNTMESLDFLGAISKYTKCVLDFREESQRHYKKMAFAIEKMEPFLKSDQVSVEEIDRLKSLLNEATLIDEIPKRILKNAAYLMSKWPLND